MTTAKVRMARRRALKWVAFGLFLLMTPLGASLAQEPAPDALPSTDEVVQKIVEMNRQRAEALRSYASMRVYHLEYHGMGDKRADLVVRMVYQAPDQKEFTILSEEGSGLLRNRVLKRLIEAEQEATNAENLRRTAIHPDNYEFQLVSYERTPQRSFYVLEATPKTKSKYLFRGRIWVDAQDFAVVRIEGEPAKNPSWWTKRNLFQHSYEKVGDFWLPMRNETFTQLRILGRSLLTIEYKEYELIETAQAQPPTPAVETAHAGGIGRD